MEIEDGSSINITTSTPNGQNFWYVKYMNIITSCLYYADSISLHINCTDKTLNELQRICLIASVQCDKNKKGSSKWANPNLMIVIKSEKDLDRIIPIMKKQFGHSIHFSDDRIELMRELFKEKE